MSEQGLDAFAHLIRVRQGVDSFGVPVSMLGAHSDDFFAVLGRIVGLSALLDYRLLLSYQGLTRSGQNEHTKLEASQLIKNSRKLLAKVPDSEDRQLAVAFLERATAHADRRNEYVHNLWPAQTGDRIFGWRPPRQLDKDNPHGTPATTVELTREEMQADLLSLASLLDLMIWQRLQQFVRHAGAQQPANKEPA